MTSEVISFNDAKTAKYIERAIESFRNDPPENDYQKGFLDALIVVWQEGLGKEGYEQ